MNESAVRNYLTTEGKAWIKFRNGSSQVVRIMPNIRQSLAAQCYDLYTAYDEHPDYLGRILFDTAGYWIYDGNVLHVNEQEQLANFIITYEEKL